MFGWFKKEFTKSPSVAAPLELINWRNNMWVMTPDGIGIIFKLGLESEVHLTDEKGGTVASKVYPTSVLRQAKFGEIPIFRRKITKEIATELGYY